MAKKKTKMTEKERRRLRIVRRIKVTVGLCAVLCAVLYLLSAFVFFKISAVEVTGPYDENGELTPISDRYTQEAIIAASGVKSGDSLVNVSENDISQAIEKLLPYIDKVTVKRVYPSTLRLTVTECDAFFAVEADSFILLNKNYKVLGAAPDKPGACAIIKGASIETGVPGEIAVFSDESYKDRVNSVVNAADDLGINGITNIDVSNIANVQMVISDRFTITLGTLTDLDEKLSTVTKTVAAELENDPDARIFIDVTDPKKAYVRDDKTPYDEETTAAQDNDDNDNGVVPNDGLG